MKRREFLRYSGIAAGAIAAANVAMPFVGSSGIANATGTTTLKLGLLAVKGHPLHTACVQFADKIAKRTDGAIKINIFPGGQLGDESAMRDLVANGGLDMASIADPIAAGILQKFNLFTLPYVWRDRAHLEKVVTGPVGRELMEDYQRKVPVKILALNWQQGIRQLLSTQKVASIGDLKGVKLRLPPIPMWEDAWSAFGALPSSIPFTEVYLALKQGVVDAVEDPLDWIYTYKFQESAKYLSLTNHVLYSNQLHMSAPVFQKLKPEHQKILEDTAVETGKQETKLVVDSINDFHKKLVNDGVKFIDIDTDPFRKRAKTIQKKYAERLGNDLYQRIVNA